MTMKSKLWTSGWVGILVASSTPAFANGFAWGVAAEGGEASATHVGGACPCARAQIYTAVKGGRFEVKSDTIEISSDALFEYAESWAKDFDSNKSARQTFEVGQFELRLPDAHVGVGSEHIWQKGHIQSQGIKNMLGRFSAYAFLELFGKKRFLVDKSSELFTFDYRVGYSNTEYTTMDDEKATQHLVDQVLALKGTSAGRKLNVQGGVEAHWGITPGDRDADHMVVRGDAYARLMFKRFQFGEDTFNNLNAFELALVSKLSMIHNGWLKQELGIDPNYVQFTVGIEGAFVNSNR